jgi:transcriptional regulator with XRE-family HTH domain
MRRLYEEANLTGRQLTAAANVSKSATSRYLRGQSLPPQRFVEALVTLGLERLNRNTDYVTVDIDAELRHWQRAWAHVEGTLYPTSKAKPTADTKPEAESAPKSIRGSWRALRGAVWAVAGVLSAFTGALGAFAGARLGSDRPASRPTRPAPATTPRSAQSPPSSAPQPGVWRPKRVQSPKAMNQSAGSGNTQGAWPTRRHIWTYSDHVRRQQG